MSLPMIFVKDQLNEFTDQGSWDGLVLIVDEDLSLLSSEWQEFIRAHWLFDQASRQGAHLISCPLAPESRLLLCTLQSLYEEANDLRSLKIAAFEAMQRALNAGMQRPCFQLAIGTYHHLSGLETAVFGALSALWVPLEARELARGGSIEALGLICGEINELRREGIGILIDKTRKLRYEGEFEDNEPMGRGRLIYNNGDIFTGLTDKMAR